MAKGGGGGRFREEHLTVTYNNNQTLSITCVPTVENPMNGEQKMYGTHIRCLIIKQGIKGIIFDMTLKFVFGG